MGKERRTKKTAKETSEFVAPELPPLFSSPMFSPGFGGSLGGSINEQHSGNIEGLGDEVESILFDLKNEAVFIKHIADSTKINTWMKTELEAMLESAKNKNDTEYIGKFESAIARLSRFNQ